MFIHQRTTKMAGFSDGQVPAGSASGLQFGQQGKTVHCQHWPSLTKYLRFHQNTQSPARCGDSTLPGFLQHLPHPTHLRGSAARWGRGCRCVGTSGSRRMGGISPTGLVRPSHRTLALREAAKSFTSIFHLSWRALLPQAMGYLAAKAFSEKAGGHTLQNYQDNYNLHCYQGNGIGWELRSSAEC